MSRRHKKTLLTFMIVVLGWLITSQAVAIPTKFVKVNYYGTSEGRYGYSGDTETPPSYVDFTGTASGFFSYRLDYYEGDWIYAGVDRAGFEAEIIIHDGANSFVFPYKEYASYMSVRPAENSVFLLHHDWQDGDEKVISLIDASQSVFSDSDPLIGTSNWQGFLDEPDDVASGYVTFFGESISYFPYHPSYNYFNVSFQITSLKPIPEPSTMLLLGTGLVGLAGLRRKFRK